MACLLDVGRGPELTSAAMRAWLGLLLALAAAGAARASPPVAGGDELGNFMTERQLVDRQDTRGPTAQRAAPMAHGASELVVAAMGYLGVPYRYGGNSFETGLDCSGFVKVLYEQAVGLLLPRRAEEQAAAGRPVERHALQPGDLVFFNTLQRAFSHVGIYVGDHRFIHSPRPGARVRLEDMRMAYWSRRFDGARRVFSPESAAPGLMTVALPPSPEPAALQPAQQVPLEAP